MQLLRSQIEDVRKENQGNVELAERRKNLVDNQAVEMQQNILNHQKKLEEVKERHSCEMKELVQQKSVSIKAHLLNQSKPLSLLTHLCLPGFFCQFLLDFSQCVSVPDPKCDSVPRPKCHFVVDPVSLPHAGHGTFSRKLPLV